MIIEYLKLSGYRRLLPSNISSFEYSPSSPMQLIIGSNGSGKSSLLSELTPVPANHKQFIKGGYKEVVCRHESSVYVLKSTYNTGTGSHSFVKDGVELNDGGTFVIQSDLVKGHFGVTREIHNLMIGRLKFSGLSTAKRRELLTRMMPTDLSYAFKVFDKVKTHHRDQLGVIKHLLKRMTAELEDNPDPHEAAKLTEEMDRLVKQGETYFNERQSGVVTKIQSPEHLKQKLEAISKRASELLKFHPSIPTGYSVSSQSDLFKAVSETEAEIKANNDRITRLAEEVDVLDRTSPNRDIELDESQIQAMRDRVVVLDDEIAKETRALESLKTRLPLVDMSGVNHPESVLNDLVTSWVGLIQEFPDNTDSRFTPGKGNAAKEDLKSIRSRFGEVDRLQFAGAGRLARLKGCPTVSCPECKHTFAPGIDPNDIPLIESELEKLDAEGKELSAKITACEEYIEAFEDYGQLVRRYKHLQNESNVCFRPMWEFVDEHRAMFTNPQAWVLDITLWSDAMHSVIKLDKLKDNHLSLTNRLRYVDEIDRDAVGYQTRRRNEIETELRAISDRNLSLGRDRTGLRNALDSLTKQDNDLARLHAELSDTLTEAGLYTEKLRQDILEDRVKQNQVQVGLIQSRLSKIQVREALIADIRKEHERAKYQHMLLGVLVKSLSPTEGLIGKYLMGFMQNIVKMANAVISEVWTTPLEVLPSKTDDSGLDYYFPLNVGEGDNQPADIADGSSSQVDMVDFAFKLLIMKFLGVEHHPLYLDEFGRTFDEQHRENLIPFINRFLELGQFQQIFYISHYVSTHGAFNQAEICVMDSANVTLPTVYNKHVVIE